MLVLFAEPVLIPGGRSGKFALTRCSATVAASARIFEASSLTLSKFKDMPLEVPASNIKPLSMLPMSPSSPSASGRTPPKPELTLRRTPMQGPSVETTSPSSDTVFMRSETWSSARRAFMTSLLILRISASSPA